MPPAPTPPEGTGPGEDDTLARVRVVGRLLRGCAIASVVLGALTTASAAYLYFSHDASVPSPSSDALRVLQHQIGESNLPENSRVGLLQMLKAQDRLIEGQDEMLGAALGLLTFAAFLPAPIGLYVLSLVGRLPAGPGPVGSSAGSR